jgi:23S rRNA pseudouridine1911/1915/1917 synthase
MTNDNDIKKLIIPSTYFGSRLDQVLAKLIPDLSRSKIQTLLKSGDIILNGKAISANYKVVGDEEIVVKKINTQELNLIPEKIHLNIIFEDEDILVINKQKNLVVHPGAGNPSGTLLNGIVYYSSLQGQLPRGGIVHRLDKDTTGLMVIAKNETAQNNLITQLQSKTVYREYRAIVWGQLWKNKLINKPIGRNPRHRTKMAINKINGKESITNLEVLERFNFHTYVRCLLKTGRTHQIRVHMMDNQSPVMGDKDYGLKKIIPTKKVQPELLDAVKNFDRQALHAISLGLNHPKTGKLMKWTIDLPEDMKEILTIIREDSKNNDFSSDESFIHPTYELNEPYDVDE